MWRRRLPVSLINPPVSPGVPSPDLVSLDKRSAADVPVCVGYDALAVLLVVFEPALVRLATCTRSNQVEFIR